MAEVYEHKNREQAIPEAIQGGCCSKLWSALRFFMEHMPVVNIFYDVFFHGLPEPDDIKDMLNVQGLLSALLLSSVCSYPGSLDYNDLTEAGTRLGECWYQDDSPDTRWWLQKVQGHHNLIAPYKLLSSVAWSQLYLSCNIMAVVWVYFSFAGVEKVKNDDTVHNVDTESNKHNCYTAWWHSSRWMLMLSTLALAAGLVYFIQASYMIGIMKFPVPVEYEDCSENPVHFPFMVEITNTYLGILIAGLCVQPLIMIVAHCQKFRSGRFARVAAFMA